MKTYNNYVFCRWTEMDGCYLDMRVYVSATNWKEPKNMWRIILFGYYLKNYKTDQPNENYTQTDCLYKPIWLNTIEYNVICVIMNFLLEHCFNFPHMKRVWKGNECWKDKCWERDRKWES